MRSDGPAGKLFTGFGVLQSGVIASHGCANGAPTDAVTRLVQRAERAFETLYAGKNIFFGDFTIGKSEPGGYRSTQGPFTVDVPGLEAKRALFHEETVDFFVFVGFGPDERNIGERAAGDPHF